MEDWWLELKYWSKRDQLSFPYVCWKNQFNYNFISEDIDSNKWIKLLKIRDICNLSIEEKRASKEIGSSLEASLVLKLNKDYTETIKGVDLSELCITSSVEIKKMIEMI